MTFPGDNQSDQRPAIPSAVSLNDHYDFIVCGSGPAGSAMAGRLAENPAARVLLIEAGGTDEAASVMVPSQWPANLGSERDWQFMSEPNSHLNGRAISLNMGKGLGGGSSINAMIWARGHKGDWEDFAAEAGDPSWGYESVLQIYRRVEDWQGSGDPIRRGVGGPVHVHSAINPEPIACALVEAAASSGLPVFESPNGEMMEGRGGVAITDVVVREGRRSSIFRCYVHPRLSQPNLVVLTHTLVTKLLFSGTSVIGVEVVQGSARRHYFAAHEVILSLGAINTPKILMQSGIGPESELHRHGIDVVQDLPGVGQNHQDHVALGCAFEYRKPLSAGSGCCEATMYWKSDASLELPNIFACQLGINPFYAAAANVPLNSWSLVAGLAHPKSRGVIRLSGPDANDPVVIEANTLTHPDDLKTALESIHLCRELGNTAARKSPLAREERPGRLGKPEMETYVRNAANSYWHQACTAKMGRDSMSVVDNRLKVYGVDKLRVADASIMPHITSGNTMAPCVIIGEKAAEMIKSDHKL